ncbi:CLUMA_CG011571, isoform A [Clunio marinus]|uniref:Large ribosomal subunit protein P2 n=1 Tax=Clunio marinus TaxID=568069 RepID=A0A1J1IDB7_9DIPT|nr:CLUMA_CG011571, isoform A [Clunio marinus]
MDYNINSAYEFEKMRYVAAYLLAVLGGNASPSNADLEKILSSVGVEVDAARVTKIIGELKGKSIEELISQGREKLSSMPAGGGAAAAAPAAGAAPAAAEEKKEEKKKVESESEEDDDMGFGLFE